MYCSKCGVSLFNTNECSRCGNTTVIISESNKKCKNCNSKIVDTFLFCPNCGKSTKSYIKKYVKKYSKVPNTIDIEL